MEATIFSIGRQQARTFTTEAGWKVIVSASYKGNYHEIAQALEEALEEVRHRIENNVQLF